MPFKSARARRDYQNARNARKREAKKKELDTLNKLGQILLFRKLTADEEKIYLILSEKYDAEIHRQKKREQRSKFPIDDQDINMYQHTSRSERIIKGDGSEQTTEQIPRLTDGRGSNLKSNDTKHVLDPIPTPNTPKLRPTSQSKEWWINPVTNEWEENPQEEDSGNVISSVWKLESIYDN